MSIESVGASNVVIILTYIMTFDGPVCPGISLFVINVKDKIIYVINALILYTFELVLVEWLGY